MALQILLFKIKDENGFLILNLRLFLILLTKITNNSVRDWNVPINIETYFFIRNTIHPSIYSIHLLYDIESTVYLEHLNWRLHNG